MFDDSFDFFWIVRPKNNLSLRFYKSLVGTVSLNLGGTGKWVFFLH